MNAGLFAGEDRWGDWNYTPGATRDGWGGRPPYVIDDDGEPIFEEAVGIRAARPWSQSATDAPTEQVRRDNTWSVYALVDADDQIFYVGYTCYFKGRFANHRADRRWKDRLADMVLLQRHTYKGDAHAAEVQLIRELQPEFNVQHKAVA